MRIDLFEELSSSIKNWWIFLLLGIMFIGTALLLMFYPIEGYTTLSVIFSISMFACGLFEIVYSVSNKSNLSSWGWYFAGGIIDLLMGLFLICYPAMSMAVLPMLVAFWLMFRGFSLIGVSMDLQRFGAKNWGWVLAIGILAILCSIAVIWYPSAGALSIVYIVAFTFLFIGIAHIMLSFDLKKLHNDNNELRKKIEQFQTQPK